MGDSPIEVLKKVTDNQFIANTNNLSKFLYRAAVDPVAYDSFQITDYINTDYFNYSSITVSSGTTSIDGNQVTWNLDRVKSGFKLETTIDIALKDGLIGVGETYPTNEKLEVVSKIGEKEENVTSTLTPILADNYQIIYEGNVPEECTVTNIPSPKKASVFDTVLITEEKPSCERYQFKGWELVTENVTKVNANYFIMPEGNVTIRATWSKLSLAKSTEGKVSQIQSLYQMMADNFVPDNVASQYVTSSTEINFGASSSYIYYVSLMGEELVEDTLNKEIVYGNDVAYDEKAGMYTLVDTISSKIGDWATDYKTMGAGHHYTCLDKTGTCATVTYINYIGSVSTRSYGIFNYTTFSNGITVEEAVKKMTTESEHTQDSTIKIVIDKWYKNNMTSHTQKLEDTTWCNDRTVGNTYGSWSKDGNAVSAYNLNYQNYNDISSNTPMFICRNKNDAYTVNDTINGNGYLEYPVSLLTADEIQYAGGGNTTYYLYIGAYWWTSSARYFNHRNAVWFFVGFNGDLYDNDIVITRGVRPSVSLAPGTRSIDGDGSPKDPFIIE